MFLLRMLTIRRVVILSIILGGVIYFVPSWYIGNYVSNITGSPVSANFSLLELFRGNIKFKELSIYSPTNFGGTKAIVFHNLKININPLSLLCPKKTINSISADVIDLNSIYAEEDNNIDVIISNTNAFFAKAGSEGRATYIVKELFLRNIHLKTYYCSDSPIVSKIPNICLKNVDSKSGLVKTASLLLTSCFAININKNDEEKISWWDKATNAIGRSINFSVNAIGTGLKMGQSAADTVSSIRYTAESLNSSFKGF